MFGSHHPGFELEPDINEEIARERLFEVSEKYGLDIEDIDLEFDSTMPYNIMGRTSVSGYSSSDPKITVGESFVNASEAEQLKTMLHEGIHVKQFQNELGEWLMEEQNTSREFAVEAEKYSNSRNLEDIEGVTEVLTDNLLPFEAETGYPYEKRKKMSELEAKGFDVESELADSIGDEISGVMDDYREIYQSFDLGGIYIERGNFNGTEYTAILSGYGEPEEAVSDYLIDDLEENYSQMLEPENEITEYAV